MFISFMSSNVLFGLITNSDTSSAYLYQIPWDIHTSFQLYISVCGITGDDYTGVYLEDVPIGAMTDAKGQCLCICLIDVHDIHPSIYPQVWQVMRMGLSLLSTMNTAQASLDQGKHNI